MWALVPTPWIQILAWTLVWLQASHLAFLGLHFPICEVGSTREGTEAWCSAEALQKHPVHEPDVPPQALFLRR